MRSFYYTDFLYVEPDGYARVPKHVADMAIYSCVRRHLTVCLLNIRNKGMTSKLDRSGETTFLFCIFLYIFIIYSIIYNNIAHLRQMSQLKIWHFWVIGIGINVCRCTFNRYSVITQFAKLAAGERLCRRCTNRKLQNFKSFKSFSWKITNFELWNCYRKWAIYNNICFIYNNIIYNYIF
jgi:hypothetical protein